MYVSYLIGSFNDFCAVLFSTVWKRHNFSVTQILRETTLANLHSPNLFQVELEWQKNTEISTLCSTNTLMYCGPNIVFWITVQIVSFLKKGAIFFLNLLQSVNVIFACQDFNTFKVFKNVQNLWFRNTVNFWWNFSNSLNFFCTWPVLLTNSQFVRNNCCDTSKFCVIFLVLYSCIWWVLRIKKASGEWRISLSKIINYSADEFDNSKSAQKCIKSIKLQFSLVLLTQLKECSNLRGDFVHWFLVDANFHCCSVTF